VIRAGRDDEYAGDALDRGVVGLGWRRVGDLAGAGTERAVRSLVAEAYPEEPAERRALSALQLHAFRSLLAPGDLVVLLRRTTPDVAVGEVTGDYRYEPGDGPAHVRPVSWLQPRLRRTELGPMLAVPALAVVTKVTREEDQLRVAEAAKGVAPTEEPAVRPAGRPVDVLRANLELARSLATAGEHLEALGVTSFEFRDVYRAAWVQAVASLDQWLGDEITGRVTTLLDGPADRWPRTFTRLLMSKREVASAAEDEIRQTMADRLVTKHLVLQHPDKIRLAVEDVTGVPDLWVRVGAAMASPLDPTIVETRLKETGNRRHKIVHRYDEDPENPPHKKAITVAETMAAIDFLDQLTEGIWTVLA
jgi:hypothetical protein